MTPVLTRPARNVAPNIMYSARGDYMAADSVHAKAVRKGLI